MGWAKDTAMAPVVQPARIRMPILASGVGVVARVDKGVRVKREIKKVSYESAVTMDERI